MKSNLEELNYNDLKIVRSEKRNSKIIVVFEAGLYSNEVFAVNPYYDEGDKKNKLQEVHFNLKITERNGEVNASVDFGSNLTHFTTGHTQIHKNMRSLFKDKKDLAIHEILTLDREYFYKEERIGKLLKMWDSDQEFKDHLINLIEKRKLEDKNANLIKCKKEYHDALKNLELAMELED